MRDDIDLKYFKHRLEQRLKEITAGQRPMEPVVLDQARVGRLSRMDAMQQQAVARAAADLTAMEDRRIRKALDRMASGDYGFCVRCEEEISEGRLRVEPGALTCIACAKAADAR